MNVKNHKTAVFVGIVIGISTSSEPAEARGVQATALKSHPDESRDLVADTFPRLLDTASRQHHGVLRTTDRRQEVIQIPGPGSSQEWWKVAADVSNS